MNRTLTAALSSMLVSAVLLAGPGVGPAQAQDHRPGEAHPFQPARLEAVLHIDMGEFYFGNLEGERNPVYRFPAETTVGIHIHNPGLILHELAIGRTAQNGEYEEVLTELVPSDLFFYWGRARVELEDATFGELEVDPGINDIWIRMNVPAEFKGEWELGCFVAGHYEAGMRATLIIE